MSLSAGAITILKTGLKTINGEYWNAHERARSKELFTQVEAKATELGLMLERGTGHQSATLQHVGAGGKVTKLIEDRLLDEIEDALSRIHRVEAKGGLPERYNFLDAEA